MAAPHDLVGELDNSQCWALNTATEHPLANCIAMDKRTGAGVCQSDCDEELLITLTFLQKVRLSGPTSLGLLTALAHWYCDGAGRRCET